MIWVEVKRDDCDFCIESGEYQVRRKGEQVGLWYHNYRIGWCNSVKHGMFNAWTLLLEGERRNG